MVTGLHEGFGYLVVTAELKYSSNNYTAPEEEIVTVEVVSDQTVKAANPMKLKAKKIAVAYKSLKKKSKIIKRAKLFTVKNAKGKLSYKLAASKRGKKSFKKMFRVNKKTGKLLVKKGLKRGTYKVKVKVKAAGNAKYKVSGWKSVIFKIRVK